MNNFLDDTICAVATPLGEGGIGIIRVSGEQALAVVSQVVKLRCGRPLESARSHRLYVSDILPVVNPQENLGTSRESCPIDEALVVVMKAPRSYTGEDVVEIHAHGGPLVLHTTCGALIRNGARLANPGEFTKRAFLNGRLDLAQAEAVLDTIQATTTSSLKAAQAQLRGTLSKEVDRMRDQLIHLLAQLEAGMDFVEEDITFIETKELEGALREIQGHLDQLLSTFEEGRIIREGARVAIIGRPNVGKSSLLNALLRTDRAIVSEIPGTTRDVLDELLNVRGIPIRLVDTAGLRETVDILEGEGIRRTQEAITQADLLLIVVDGSVAFSNKDRDLLQDHSQQRRLIVVNKSDLPSQTEESEIRAILPTNGSFGTGSEGEYSDLDGLIVRLSAKTGEGMDQLRDRIQALFIHADFEPGSSPLVTKLRHQCALKLVKEALDHALDSIGDQLSGEFIALDLRAALEHLGEITGSTSNDDILDRIFQEFCIGK
ncbi:MAG: tRNA uridine-5-carboxymethylaminomethyl(34) synthesis GTPase MnmE [Nitrospirota bacterium]|nr:tRNA uridine-5-carboxymethylaminomethyl(34) synthesis GTPase MnmE [Nitrospirota bacterium]